MSARRPKSWPVVVAFAAVIAVQVVVMTVSIEMQSAVRAYVAGESLYSKAQKDAQIHLLEYADTLEEEHYRRFLEALKVPLGDRSAREELAKTRPDLVFVRRSFLEGGNHPDDITGLIWLYRWFHASPLMAESVATWKQGDAAIDEMRVLAGRLRQSVEAHGTADLRPLRREISSVNVRLSALEGEFSSQLGRASRQVKGWLLGIDLAIAAVLSLAGLGYVRQNLRHRAAAEMEVRRRQESLQHLMDSTAEGLFGIDAGGRCTFVNRSALEMLGYAHESDLVGRGLHGLIHHRRSDGTAYRARECRIYRAFRRRRPAHVVDEVFSRRDGTSFPVEYWSYPVFRDGVVTGMVVTFFDITERMRSRDALRRSEQRLATLVDTVADAVITVDTQGDVALFNRGAERIFRRPAIDVLGRPFVELLPHALRDSYRARIRGITANPEEADVPGTMHELMGLRGGGDEFPMEASLSRLETGQGTLVTVVLRDVTEQRAARQERQAREALEMASRAKTEFLSRMSHELRTPLNAVLGFAELMAFDRAHSLHAQQMQRVQHIQNAGAHLLALVNDVLDLSQVESGKMPLSLGAVDACGAANEAFAVVAQLAAARGVHLVMSLPCTGAAEANAWVLADRVRLRQVLINLLSNAVKYTGAGGRVELSLECAGDERTLVVSDTGVGMSAEQLAHLFEPFNRLGAERTAVEGTGIGLVLTRHLVLLMRGRLAINSTAGRGTVARATFRPARVAPAVRSGQGPTSVSAKDGHLDVIYAEDNDVNVEIVRQMMALRPGVVLRIATSGALAFEMARVDPPDLMLVDMNLGDMTGTELAAMLRRDPATADVHLVALSADALPEQIDAALSLGFADYLTKPVNFSDLLKVLDMRARLASRPRSSP